MNPVLLLNLTLLISLSSGCITNYKPSSVEVIELNYGLCETENLYNEKMDASPSGNYMRSTDFKLIAKTDTIPAKIGQEFGVSYIIKSDETNDVLTEQIWIYPETIKNQDGKVFSELRYKVGKTTNIRTYSSYILEKECEVVAGEWTYQIYYGGVKVYEKKFILI